MFTLWRMWAEVRCSYYRHSFALAEITWTIIEIYQILQHKDRSLYWSGSKPMIIYSLREHRSSIVTPELMITYSPSRVLTPWRGKVATAYNTVIGASKRHLKMKPYVTVLIKKSFQKRIYALRWSAPVLALFSPINISLEGRNLKSASVVAVQQLLYKQVPEVSVSKIIILGDLGNNYPCERQENKNAVQVISQSEIACAAES